MSLLTAVLPREPAVGTFGPGGHDFTYWSTLIPAAFAFLAAQLD
ncbi:hypothetical protein ACWT_6296 [Actinoplanes sp. SE50]|nr:MULTISPECIES: hypothetical protein [unclassified Actinoplanes]AEV87311.1 hypothetical protein ACPL_6429 [Actinoplanes sp. SE50/110]ATO85711.1 hypothetical protein ACWT_6296 [Actinoplanes sp. SE50]SLM03124.1 hypothetical protein ACSP50_6413 [Actinoplanes sp. SE50/110]